MRIAVCFYGQLRTAEFAYPNLKRYFGDFYSNIDFFVHTWNVDFVTRPINLLRTIYTEPSKIEESSSNEYRSLYSPVEFICDDQVDLRERMEFPNGRECDEYYFVSEMYFPYFSFYKSIQLKQQHEQANNFTYDVVIKLRPDIIFPPDRNFQNDLDNFLTDTSKIYICYHDDVFHIGTSENMDRAAACVIDCKEELRESKRLPFSIFEDHLLKNSIEIVKLEDCRFAVLRQELKTLDVNRQYHEICYLNSLLYSEMFYHLEYSWKWWYNPSNPNWKEDMYSELEKMLNPKDLRLIKQYHRIDIV